ncbi:uncharacterized protein BDCG_00945 [Blastomyces dermatitidis ER-3]|nr:uncharacterized protein BDCG_00945 [Blastomyces dermatitidis ER-3]EEQ84140.1 hypothetical protein BDCG_00945 [Blastomyces dermatitidis ER-3]EQL34436.1 hypothetical protein BDFG_03782 [Blastomyces dermatitidis ATCC 26199]
MDCGVNTTSERVINIDYPRRLVVDHYIITKRLKPKDFSTLTLKYLKTISSSSEAMNSSPVPGSEVSPAIAPIELSFLAPKSLYTTVHIHLTFFATSTLLFLTTSSMGESGPTSKPMGSFVYAMPDRTKPKNTISTALYTSPSTVDYATRTARILSRRMDMPVYVGCSVDFSDSTVEEEMEGLKKISETVMEKWQERKGQQQLEEAMHSTVVA